MCGCGQLHEGAEAAGWLLRHVYKIDVEKALNPLDDTDFLVISARLSAALQKAAKGEEAKALNLALQALDVDWTEISAAARNKVITTVRNLVSGVPELLLPKVDKVLTTTGLKVAGDTKKFANKKFALKIGSSLNQQDRSSIEFLKTAQRLFITDEYGRKVADASKKAADIVAHGLEHGLGSADITEKLQVKLSGAVARPESYWDVVSMAYANDARSVTQINGLSEAGIEAYQFLAVEDENTTETCYMLSGRVFSVGSAADTMAKLSKLEDPQDIKDAKPWIKSGRTEDGTKILYIDKGGSRQLVAEVVKPSSGKDSPGEYKLAMSNKQMEDSGIPIPPLHGRCRSTIIPV